MNKVFIGLILAVCVLGMALVMLNDRLGRTPDQRSTATVAEPRPANPDQARLEAEARAREIADAAARQEELARLPARENSQETTPLPPPKMPQGLTPSGEFERPQPPATPEKPAAVAQPTEAKPTPPPPVQNAEPQKPKPEPKPQSVPQPEPKPDAKPAQTQPPAQKPETAAPAPKPETPKETAPAGMKNATRFVVYSREKGATVRMGGDAKMEFSHMTLENPNRVVVDVPGEWQFPPAPGIPKNDLVQAVRVGKNGGKTRIVIDLKDKPRKVVVVPFKDGRGLDVRVDK